MENKMNLGGAGPKTDNRADATGVHSKQRVQNVAPRPSGFPNAKAMEPIEDVGKRHASSLKMQGMK